MTLGKYQINTDRGKGSIKPIGFMGSLSVSQYVYFVMEQGVQVKMLLLFILWL